MVIFTVGLSTKLVYAQVAIETQEALAEVGISSTITETPETIAMLNAYVADIEAKAQAGDPDAMLEVELANMDSSNYHTGGPACTCDRCAVEREIVWTDVCPRGHGPLVDGVCIECTKPTLEWGDAYGVVWGPTHDSQCTCDTCMAHEGMSEAGERAEGERLATMRNCMVDGLIYTASDLDELGL